MWYRLFTRFVGTRRIFASSAALPPAVLWLLPDWMRQKPVRDENAEPDKLLLVLRKAKLAEIRKDYTKSEHLYHQGLQILDEQYEAGEVSDSNLILFRLQIYNMMANAALSRKDFVTAETLFKSCVQGFINQLDYSPKHLAVVEVSLKLAIIYAIMGRQTDAETGYKFCLEALESNKLVQESADKAAVELSDEAKNALALYGMCLDAYARFLIDGFRYGDAIGVAKKAIEICDRVFPPDHPTRLSVFNLLGNALVGSGEAKEAEKVFRDCVTSAKRALDHEIAIKRAGIQVVCKEVDKINELELARVLCACQCNCANTLFRLNLADVKHDDRREAEARQLCYAAKAIGEKYKDDDCSREVRQCIAKFQTEAKKNNEDDKN